jgi:hypothetical protein
MIIIIIMTNVCFRVSNKMNGRKKIMEGVLGKKGRREGEGKGRRKEKRFVCGGKGALLLKGLCP